MAKTQSKPASTAPQQKPKKQPNPTNTGVAKGTGGDTTSSPDVESSGSSKDRTTWTDFTARGVDTASLMADIQDKYGVIAGSEGRRGSQARAILAEVGNKSAREFLSSDLYAQLMEDPKAINNKAVQGQLQAALGDEWKQLASGRKSSEGTVIYESLEDSDALTELLKIKGTPFSLVRDIMQKGNGGSVDFAGQNGGVNEMQLDQAVTPESSPVTGAITQPTTRDDQTFAGEKRV